jgi:hypothetical protein
MEFDAILLAAYPCPSGHALPKQLRAAPAASLTLALSPSPKATAAGESFSVGARRTMSVRIIRYFMFILSDYQIVKLMLAVLLI